MDDINKHIKMLENDQKRIDNTIDGHKKKFIDQIRSGLGEDIIKGIAKPKEEIIEEEQTKGLFRVMKEWISKLSKK
tara:strand:- start:16158 stop:16385 length:228 start_codon:yes stop_codon:yes gene_type:complete